MESVFCKSSITNPKCNYYTFLDYHKLYYINMSNSLNHTNKQTNKIVNRDIITMCSDTLAS